MSQDDRTQIIPLRAQVAHQMRSTSAPNGQILIVGRPSLTLEAMERELQQHRMQVFTVTSAPQAMAFLQSKPCEVVIVSKIIDGIAVFDLVRAIRARHPSLAVIVAAEKREFVDAFQAGAEAQGYIKQPPPGGQIAETVYPAVHLSRLATACQGIEAFDPNKSVFIDGALNYRPVHDMTSREVWGYHAVPSKSLNHREHGANFRRHVAQHMATHPGCYVVPVSIKDIRSDAFSAFDDPLAKYADKVVLSLDADATLEQTKGIEDALYVARKGLGYRLALTRCLEDFRGVFTFARLKPTVFFVSRDACGERPERLESALGLLIEHAKEEGAQVVLSGVNTPPQMSGAKALGIELIEADV